MQSFLPETLWEWLVFSKVISKTQTRRAGPVRSWDSWRSGEPTVRFFGDRCTMSTSYRVSMDYCEGASDTTPQKHAWTTQATASPIGTELKFDDLSPSLKELSASTTPVTSLELNPISLKLSFSAMSIGSSARAK